MVDIAVLLTTSLEVLMNTQSNPRAFGSRVAVLGALALLAGPLAVVAVPTSAGATTGTTTVTCLPAQDDSGAVVSEAVGAMSTASAVSYARQSMPDPAPMSYTLDGLPETTSVGASLSAAFLWGGDSHTTGALAGPFSSFFGLTTGTANPVVTSLEIAGPATRSGLTVTTTSSIPLDGTDAPIPLWMPGTITTTAAGAFTVWGSQRVTFVINKDIDFQGIAVRVNTLTFVCSTDVLATVYVIAPGAPIARIDDFRTESLVVDDAGAVSGATTLDVLANDSPSASAIDPSTLTVTDPGPFTTAVVDGKIVVTGGPDQQAWQTTGPPAQCQPETSYTDSPVAADDVTSSDPSGSSTAPTTVVSSDGDSTTTYTGQTIWSCLALVEYSICTVDTPPICSTSQAFISYSKTDQFQYSASDSFGYEETLAVTSAGPAVPVPARPSYAG